MSMTVSTIITVQGYNPDIRTFLTLHSKWRKINNNAKNMLHLKSYKNKIITA